MTKLTTLRDAVREQLLNRPNDVTLKQVADESLLSFGWVQAFARLECKNPGVNTIETLKAYMDKKGWHV